MGDWSQGLNAGGHPAGAGPAAQPTAAAAAAGAAGTSYLRPLTLADVLDGMFRLLLANWRTYALALGVVLVPLNFAVAYLTTEVVGGAGLFEQLSNPASAEAFLAGGPSLIPFLGLIAVSLGSFAFVTPFVNGTACRIAAEAYAQQQPEPRGVLRSTLQKYWALVGLSVLIVVVPTLVVALPAAGIFAGIVLEQPALTAVGGVLTFGAVLAAIALVIAFSLSYVVVVVERAGPVAALRRSFRLVRGRFWPIFGTLLLAGIISGIVAQIASFPFAIPGDLFGDWLGVIFTTAGSVVAAIVTTPLSANAQTLLYFDGRVRLEGYDLQLISHEIAREHPGGEHLFG